MDRVTLPATLPRNPSEATIRPLGGAALGAEQRRTRRIAYGASVGHPHSPPPPPLRIQLQKARGPPEAFRQPSPTLLLLRNAWPSPSSPPLLPRSCRPSQGSATVRRTAAPPTPHSPSPPPRRASRIAGSNTNTRAIVIAIATPISVAITTATTTTVRFGSSDPGLFGSTFAATVRQSAARSETPPPCLPPGAPTSSHHTTSPFDQALNRPHPRRPCHARRRVPSPWRRRACKPEVPATLAPAIPYLGTVPVSLQPEAPDRVRKG